MPISEDNKTAYIAQFKKWTGLIGGKKICAVCGKLRERHIFEVCGEHIETATCHKCNRKNRRSAKQAAAARTGKKKTQLIL